MLLFLVRHSVAGFISMVGYDICLDAYRKIINSRIANSTHDVLMGDCESKRMIKGMHGAIFCTTSNLFKLYVSQIKHR